MVMALPLCRRHCFLRRAQMLLLFLGIAYLMAGSILLLQRSALRVSQSSPSSLPPLPALPAPPAAMRTPGLGARARSRWAATQGMHWPAPRNLGVQRLHRRWFHSLTQETQQQRAATHRNSRHKGTYVGCFMHDATERALGGTILYDLRKMTSSLCQDTCSESGYKFAGLEYGAECHCGNHISSLQAPQEDCSLMCRGERESYCGGVGRLSIYKVEEEPPGHRKFRHVRYSGCFQIPKNTSDAFSVHFLQPNLTAQSCIETCTDKELPLAVLQQPHCFCSWAALLLSLGPQLEGELCEDTSGLNHTNDGSNTSSTTDQDHYHVYETPVLDSRCRERVFLPQRSSFLVALSSFPGAGNTWVRHLIELVTGYYTGSFYFDGTLYNQGFKGEKDYWKSGRSICVKTHESGQREIEMFDAAILLIRNPYRSLVAEFNRKCAGHLGYATDTQWSSKEWPEFVDSYAPWWASHALTWLKFGRRVLVVHYEDLQRALIPQLRLISAFLNATMTEERLICARSNQDGHFKRSGTQRPSFDPFTPEMKRTIDSYIQTVDQALRDRSLGRLPDEYGPIC